MQTVQRVSAAALIDGLFDQTKRQAGGSIHVQNANIIIHQEDGNTDGIHYARMVQVNGGAHRRTSWRKYKG